ncbi:glycosyltransferase [bacterium]|nr:glycosyltransferase [bacterium]
MNNYKTLTLAFSCLGKNLEQLIKSLELITVSEKVKILIVVQKWECKKAEIESKNIKVVYLDSVGLSRSRNSAIKYAETNHIWFLDDDVLLNNENVLAALDIINSEKSNFYRVRVGCIEWDNKDFKRYKKIDRVKKIHLLQCSSIEIIADLDFIRSFSISFNEKIGLGTPYQANEENNFLIDSWEQGASFTFVDQVLVRHTCLVEARVPMDNKICQIKGATASRYKILGLGLLCRWVFRFGLSQRRGDFALSLFKGFLRGYKFFK